MNKTDMIGMVCETCKVGKYQETTIYDDWDGTLHCNSCGIAVMRWRIESALAPKERGEGVPKPIITMVPKGMRIGDAAVVIMDPAVYQTPRIKGRITAIEDGLFTLLTPGGTSIRSGFVFLDEPLPEELEWLLEEEKRVKAMAIPSEKKYTEVEAIELCRKALLKVAEQLTLRLKAGHFDGRDLKPGVEAAIKHTRAEAKVLNELP